MTNGTLANPVYAGVFGCIMVLGLPLNALSLWLLLHHHSLKSPTGVLMVNLAISDLLLVISLPMRIYFYATGSWPLGRHACTLLIMLYRNNIRSSCFFITFISVDRLLAVVYPLRSRHLRTSTNAWKSVALVWLFMLVLSIPESVGFLNYQNENNISTCFENRRQSSAMTLVYLQLVCMIIMLTVNVVCTVLVSWTLRRHLSDSAKVKNKVNVMLIFAMNLLMFTVCFLPVNITLVTNIREVNMPLLCVASMNCCLDPLLYYFSFDAFWRKPEDVDHS
ncbi:lysophosphatidic acid receptor 6-like [Parambassis ranga]|uniref:Lysophosphatidic acid receptor 6-like n=1 Tax=Parambassis ranga TaxID=210632 RepID=A0A6P7JGF5_9TELE|nr:lysophosphatidic acid receptor 6-like [Parambassis ranga]